MMFSVPTDIKRPSLSAPIICTKRIYGYFIVTAVILFLTLILRIIIETKTTFQKLHLQSDRDLELFILPKDYVKAKGAYCLDGSSPAYYFRPSIQDNINLWLIFLPGESWCWDSVSCYERSLTVYGTSNKLKVIEDSHGIMSADCKENEFFCHWNLLVFHSCDGSGFLGNRSSPLYKDEQELYLRGAVIFDALIEYVLSRSNQNFEQVILAGSSASGLGALIHADRLRGKLPQSVKSLHVLVDAALFVDVSDTRGNRSMEKLLKQVFQLHNIKDSQSIKECSSTRSDKHRCLFPDVYHDFVFTPVLFTNSLYDTWQLNNSWRISCHSNINSCKPQDLRVLKSATRSIIHLQDEINQSEKHFVYVYQCPFHNSLTHSMFFKQYGNYSINRVISFWLNHEAISTPSISLDTTKFFNLHC